MKSIVFIALLMTTFSVTAENWQPVADSSSGQRLIVDIDAIDIDEYEKNQHRIFSKFTFVTVDGMLPPFAAVIDTNDCLVNQAGIMYYVFETGVKQTYFWSMKGDKMYDSVGQFLCNYLVLVLEEHEKQKTSTKKFM